MKVMLFVTKVVDLPDAAAKMLQKGDASSLRRLGRKFPDAVLEHMPSKIGDSVWLASRTDEADFRATLPGVKCPLRCEGKGVDFVSAVSALCERIKGAKVKRVPREFFQPPKIDFVSTTRDIGIV